MRRILFSILSFALLWAFAGTVQAAPTTRPTSQPVNKKTHHPHQHKAHAKKATKHKATYLMTGEFTYGNTDYAILK